MFVKAGVKINADYYCDDPLKKQLLPSICKVSQEMFIFQQDNAPAHHARDTVEFLK